MVIFTKDSGNALLKPRRHEVANIFFLWAHPPLSPTIFLNSLSSFFSFVVVVNVVVVLLLLFFAFLSFFSVIFFVVANMYEEKYQISIFGLLV